MITGLTGIFRTLILPVTWGLLHFLWQGALVAIVLGGLLQILRKSRPQVRYLLSCAALMIMIILPIFTALRHTGPGAEVAAMNIAGEQQAGMLESGITPGEGMIPDEGATPVESLDRADTAGPDSSRRIPWLISSGLFTLLPGPDSFVVIFMLWMSGVMVLGIVHFLGWRRVHRLTTHGTSPLPDYWEETVAELTARLRNLPRVRVMQSALASVPTVIGWLRPVVLIPVSAITGLDQAQLRAIIAHELAHVQRFDYLVNLLQVGTETLLFYHPAVWWVSRRIRRERELCCDDTAVALCGDHLLYARALLSLEELRPGPQPALAASGGSLSERIYRLLGGIPMSATQRTRPYLAGLMLASTLLLGCSVMALKADATSHRADPGTQVAGETVSVTPGTTLTTSQPATPAVPIPSASIPVQTGDQDSWQGRWEIHTGENGLHLVLRYGQADKRESGWGNMMGESRFTGLDFDRQDEFELRGEAGVISFTGEFTRTQLGHEGDGTYTFTPNRDFPRSLQRLGITDIQDRYLLGYTMNGLTIAMVRDVQDLGYRELDAGDALNIAMFKITAEFIREIQQVGYDNLEFRRLVEFRIHGVSPEFIRNLAREGFDDVSARRLVEFRIHGVTTEYIQEMRNSGFELDERGLVEFRIHGVNPEFMHEMAELGYRNLDSRQLVDFRIHGVTPEFVGTMAELGYTDISSRQLIDFRIHGVTPEYISDLRRDGYEDLSPRRLVEYRIHSVTPEFVGSMAELGYTDISSRQLIDFRIHGVTPEFVGTMAELGYTDISSRQLIDFRIHGVTPEYVRGLNQMGFRDIPVRSLVEARIYGVTLEYIRYVREERELTDLDLEEIIKLKKYNIIKP